MLLTAGLQEGQTDGSVPQQPQCLRILDGSCRLTLVPLRPNQPPPSPLYLGVLPCPFALLQSRRRFTPAVSHSLSRTPASRPIYICASPPLLLISLSRLQLDGSHLEQFSRYFSSNQRPFLYQAGCFRYGDILYNVDFS